MIESLHANHVKEVLELGAWRDEGRLFAVGLNGKVSKHEDGKEKPSEPGQWEGRASSPPPASPASPGAAPHAEPPGSDRVETLTERYLGFRPEILLYYPTAHFREADYGLWITVRIYPLGTTGPCYWVCLFLPQNPEFSPKGFAFRRLSPTPLPVGPRHTNYPDGSICAFTDDDDAWRPGDSPKILLNLYAEWLVCHLFLRIERRWPGRQVGLDATYRQSEFDAREWCDCGSGRRYGECHSPLDAAEVAGLKKSGRYKALEKRTIPEAILSFARTRWNKLPDVRRLHIHRYAGLPPRF